MEIGKLKFSGRSLAALALLTALNAPLPAATPATPPAETEPTVITAQSNVTWSTDTATYSTFDGNVTITGTNLRLTCDHLEIAATRTGDKSTTVSRGGQFQRILATGKVRLIQGDREATCGRAELLPAQNQIILTENPMVIDHGAVADGAVTYLSDTLIIKRGERKIEGNNVQIKFPPLKDLGFDNNQKLTPAPAAAPANP